MSKKTWWSEQREADKVAAVIVAAGVLAVCAWVAALVWFK